MPTGAGSGKESHPGHAGELEEQRKLLEERGPDQLRKGPGSKNVALRKQEFGLKAEV